jgi:hypothetical protein
VNRQNQLVYSTRRSFTPNCQAESLTQSHQNRRSFSRKESLVSLVIFSWTVASSCAYCFLPPGNRLRSAWGGIFLSRVHVEESRNCQRIHSLDSNRELRHSPGWHARCISHPRHHPAVGGERITGLWVTASHPTYFPRWPGNAPGLAPPPLPSRFNFPTAGSSRSLPARIFLRL